MDSSKVFFPNLDGLRFFAFFAVFINHAFSSLRYFNNSENYNFARTTFLLNGDLGVNFFFVLSGFLITFLLLIEKKNTGSINLKNFYMRRVLRIWPLYFFIVFLCLIVLPLFQPYLPSGFPINPDIKPIGKLFYLTFTGNFDYLFHGIKNVLIGILWSVSVEEQFYLFWPLIVFIIPRKILLPTFISILISTIAFRYFCSNGNVMIIKYHSLSCATYLSSGAIAAYCCTKNTFIDIIKRIPKYVIVLVYTFSFILIPFRMYVWKLGTYYIEAASLLPLLLAIFFAFIILEQNYASHSFYKIGKSKFISRLGKYTYGMYCYHIIIFFIITLICYLSGIKIIGMNKFVLVGITTTSLIITVLFSKLSFQYFELPFLKLKNRFL